MHGRFDDTLHFTPAGSNLLIVTGPLVAEKPDDLGRHRLIGAALPARSQRARRSTFPEQPVAIVTDATAAGLYQ